MIQEIKTSKFDGFGVLVPDDAHSFEIITNVVEGGKHICFLRGNPDYECNYTANLPDAGQYKVIGIQTEMTEEQAKDIVDSFDLFGGINVGYSNYTQNEPVLDTSLESFNSLMQKLEIKLDTKTLIIQKLSRYGKL